VAEPKTQATDDDVDAFIESLDEGPREDSRRLIELLEDITGHPPVLWGKIVGFDTYSVSYADGSERPWPAIGFSPRKGKLTLYCMAGDHSADLAELGKHSTSKACLYVRRLSDVDEAVLRRILERSYATTKAEGA
jgi:hypothetical protein